MMEGLRRLRSDAEDLLRKFAVLHDRMERKLKMDVIVSRVQSTMSMKNEILRLLSETDEVVADLNQKALLLDGDDAVPESLDSELEDLMRRLSRKHQLLTVLNERIREMGGSEIVFVNPSSAGAMIPYVEPAGVAAAVAAVESPRPSAGEGVADTETGMASVMGPLVHNVQGYLGFLEGRRANP